MHFLDMSFDIRLFRLDARCAAVDWAIVVLWHMEASNVDFEVALIVEAPQTRQVRAAEALGRAARKVRRVRIRI